MPIIHLKKDSFPNPHYGITYCGKLIRNPYLPWPTHFTPGVGYAHAVSLVDIDKVSCAICRKTVFPDPRTLWQRGVYAILDPMNPWREWLMNLNAWEIEIRLAYLQTLPQPLDQHDAMVHLLLTWVINSRRLGMEFTTPSQNPRILFS